MEQQNTRITPKQPRQVTYLYNCKRCRIGKRVEYTAYSPSNVTRVDDKGQRQSPGAWLTAIRRDGTRQYSGDPIAICSCGKPMEYGVLQPVLRPEVRCDARCTNARGFLCECSCGGKNHGAGWGVGVPAFTSMVAA